MNEKSIESIQKRVRLAAMKASDDLTYMANLYMALADRTRLRILNLLSEQEVCVASFTDVLGDSQPKISRHLAYLRNAGIVEARRDGKWMHYRINWPEDDSLTAVIRAALDSVSRSGACTADRAKHLSSLERIPTPATSYRPPDLDIYAEAYINDDREPEYERSSHNDLDEFLL